MREYFSDLLGIKSPSKVGRVWSDRVCALDFNDKRGSDYMTKYIEVKRPAKAGERIRIVDTWETFGKYRKGDEFIVDATSMFGAEVREVSDSPHNPEVFILNREYVVLEPVEPSTLTEMPKVGDKVRCVGERYMSPKYDVDYEIIGIDGDGDAYFILNGDRFYIQNSDIISDFDQFELVEEAEVSEKVPRTDRDLIVELAYTVSKLNNEVKELRDLAETTDKKAEMLIDDVSFLDERTEVSEIASELVDLLTKDNERRID